MTTRRGRWQLFTHKPSILEIAGLVVTFGAALALGFAWSSWVLVCRGNRCPPVEILESYTPRQTSKLFARDGRFVAELGLERRTLIQLKDIPKIVRDAFVITEDKRFYSHAGIDWIRVIGAGLRNVRAGGYEQGFSTITMQLARNVFPEQISREKNLIRKLKEMHVAAEIERRYSKEKILELYLNQINLGSGAYGVETASQRYFGKSARELSVAEAATLAALPKAPNRYSPRRHPDLAIQRRNTIIELMRRDGIVSDVDASLARAFPLQLAQRAESGEIAPYFVEWVRQLLDEKFGPRLYEQGLKVYTSLDLDMQSAAERALENQLRAIEAGRHGPFKHQSYEQYVARSASSQSDASTASSPYLQGSFVAVDPRDGAVRALVGGRDFEDSKFNRAVQALRQPGSTFKPFVYTAAVQSGRTPAYIVDDAPVSLPQLEGEWTPQNYDNKFEGPMTMRRGLYQSRNIVAIRVGMELGEQKVIEAARKFGITTPIPPYPSIFIGSAEVYPVEEIAAYTAFANLGMRYSANPIVRVENQRGDVLWQPTAERERVMTPEEAWLMVSMMKDVVLRGSAAGSVWSAGFHLPSAGKTGTTNDGADVWFIGYTADLVAGVWMGFDRPQKIKTNAQGGILAAPAYTAFMTEVYSRRPAPPDWPMPAGIVAREIERSTGIMPSPACPATEAYTEYFIAGTEPTRPCVGGRSAFYIPDTARGMLPARTPAAVVTPLPKPATPGKRDSASIFKIPN